MEIITPRLEWGVLFAAALRKWRTNWVAHTVKPQPVPVLEKDVRAERRNLPAEY